MKTQKKILWEYNSLMGFPTLNEISRDTGIHKTRVFRIIHGYEMKLGEYEIFSSKILAMKEKRASYQLEKQNALKNIFAAFVEQYFQEREHQASQQQTLTVQKVWLTNEERKILKALIYNLNSFIKSVQTTKHGRLLKQKKKENITVFWGALKTPK